MFVMMGRNYIRSTHNFFACTAIISLEEYMRELVTELDYVERITDAYS